MKDDILKFLTECFLHTYLNYFYEFTKTIRIFTKYVFVKNHSPGVEPGAIGGRLLFDMTEAWSYWTCGRAVWGALSRCTPGMGPNHSGTGRDTQTNPHRYPSSSRLPYFHSLLLTRSYLNFSKHLKNKKSQFDAIMLSHCSTKTLTNWTMVKHNILNIESSHFWAGFFSSILGVFGQCSAELPRNDWSRLLGALHVPARSLRLTNVMINFLLLLIRKDVVGKLRSGRLLTAEYYATSIILFDAQKALSDL